MILTFDTLKDNWVIKYKIQAAKENSLKLQIGVNNPTVGIINRKTGQVTYPDGYTGYGYVHVFFGHGSDTEIDGITNPVDFCNLLRDVTQINNNPLLLVSCRSGKSTYAKQVAKILGVDVFAPEGRCIFGKKRFAVIDDKYYSDVKKKQDDLVNSGKTSDEIFTSLIDFVRDKKYGVVHDWIEIKDIHNDFTKMGFRKFSGRNN